MNEEMKDRICLFAGTTEGRNLAAILRNSVSLTVCVATEYGEIMLDGLDGISIRTGRMDEQDMEKFFRSCGFGLIIDATHPYAQIVSGNISAAAERCNIKVMRILRDSDLHVGKAVYVGSVEEARDYLSDKEGRVFITTGAKELSSYVGLDMSRVWVRVLPCESSLEACRKAGIPVPHIVAAQGPFSYEMNLAQLKMIRAGYLVTKESGNNGGFDQKIKAALDAGAVPVIVGQPHQGAGYSLEEAVSILGKRYALPERMLYIIGIGPGNQSLLTKKATDALTECDAIIGAGSVTSVLVTGKPVYDAFTPEQVLKVLDDHPSIRRAAIVMRGDVGFFSGARRLVEEFGKDNLKIIPGISSLSAFAARLGTGWDDCGIVSLHGRSGNLIHAVCRNEKTFVLTGGKQTAGEICRTLCHYEFGDLPVTVGERLSYPDERITRGTAAELSGREFDTLCVMLIENKSAVKRIRHGIPDDEFIRSDVPMTKSEVRAVSVSMLDLRSDSIVWDIGAGTGSVSVECALSAFEGSVFAIEKDACAADLIHRNAIRFRTANLEVVEGSAPDALSGLPTPTHAFIGGTSGNLEEILSVLLERNPDVRIVINTVTLESQAEASRCAGRFCFSTMEAVTVNIARSRIAGRYHLMGAQNPVTIYLLQGGKPDV